MTSKIIYDTNLVKTISFFEARTHTKLKDCLIYQNSLLFVVQPGQIAKAIGKKGANVKMLEFAFKKRVKLVEFSEDPVIFINNLIYPLRAREITKEDKTIIVRCDDTKTKGLLIGRNSQNIKKMLETAKRYFDIEKIRVE